jgi:DNA-binding CsgD family transcriptional regulator
MVEQSESNFYWFNHLIAAGWVEAHTGRLDRAAAAAAAAWSIAGNKEREALARALLGFVALSRRDLAGAVAHLSAADEIIQRLGQREPAQHRFQPDLIEALIGTGDLDRAQAQVARLAARGEILPRPWTLATGARCRGLLLAARGELDGAAAAMREALAHHERLEMPFERGRTLLAYGQVLRRGNERRQARAVLGEALAVFGALEAPVWADRAREELDRMPVRRSATGLTATEEHIARLAAAGLSNREIAEQAFISLKTVEANLSRVYAKFGVRSRAQLVRVIAHPQLQTRQPQ